MRRVVPMLAFLCIPFAGAEAARTTLGVFEGWGAFRDDRPIRCFAISEPVRRSARQAPWRAFASVANWPAQRARGQVHIRLRATKQPGAPVWLAIGEQRFRLAAGPADAWAPDSRVDAAIVAAIRSAKSMSVETRGANGRAMVDAYALRGAATAIDAASLGCANLR